MRISIFFLGECERNDLIGQVDQLVSGIIKISPLPPASYTQDQTPPVVFVHNRTM
jgi:hypothetical protein